MIKNLKIKNFQCHQEQEFELDSGVNVFVGKSGAGKSAGVVRPLKWLVFNRPLGDSFRRWGSDTTWTEIQLAEGVNIARKKSDKENCYEMLEGVKGVQYFSSFGQTPPESIQSVLNLSQINFQFQHDQLYLLSHSPSEVGRILNELTGMDRIDRAFSNIGSRIRRETQEVTTSAALKEKIEKELEHFIDLDKLDLSISVYEELDNQASVKAIRASSLRSLSIRIANSDERIGLFKGFTKLQQTISETDQRFALFEELSDRGVGLYTISGAISLANNKIRALSRVSELAERLENLQAGKIRAEELESQAKAIEMLATRRWSLGAQIGKMETVLEDLHQQFDELMPDQCPLCGRSK